MPQRRGDLVRLTIDDRVDVESTDVWVAEHLSEAVDVGAGAVEWWQ